MNTRPHPARRARRAVLASGLAVAAALSGCMNLAPDYERPAAPVPAQLPGAAGAPARSILPGWDALLLDERARRLVRLALQHNRDLRVAELNLARARAQLTVTDADRWPTVSAVVSGTRQPGSNGTQTGTYLAGLSVSAYEVDLWSRVRNAGDAARASLAANEALRRNAELSVVSAVAGAWLAWVADEDLIALAERTLRSREETARLVALRVQVGAAAEPERLAADSLTAQARAALAQLQRQRQADESALAVLLGQPLPTDLRPTAPADRSALLDAEWLARLQPGTDSAVLLERPDLVAAEQQLLAAHANIGAARAARFPRLTLTGSAGAASSHLSRLVSDPSFAWSMVVQASAAIFDAGRNEANVRLAEVNRDLALAQYDKAIQTAFKEAADALVGQDAWTLQLEALLQQLRSERERARLTTLRYEAGATSALDQLDAQRSLFATEQAVIQTRLGALQNRLALYKALGGWPDPAVRPANGG